MRVLLDECFPRALRVELPGHEVTTVAEAGWAGVNNGALLQLAATRYEVLLTVDRNLEYRLIYRLDEARVLIGAVIHGRQDFGSFVARIHDTEI